MRYTTGTHGQRIPLDTSAMPAPKPRVTASPLDNRRVTRAGAIGETSATVTRAPYVPRIPRMVNIRGSWANDAYGNVYRRVGGKWQRWGDNVRR